MTPRRSEAWFDAQYNNRARVADAAELLDRWARASALVRAQAACRLDLRYGPEADQTLDAFLPDQVLSLGRAPVLIVIHGGYWRSLDKSDYSFVASSFVDEGALVLVPNYTLCPATRIDHIALQLTEAVAWAWREAAALGGNPNQIVVLGHSAGGHLAAMLSCCDWKRVGVDLPRRLVKGAMSISGVHELEPLLRAPFVRSDLGLTPAGARRLSPNRYPAPQAPHLMMTLCGADESEEFRRQNRLLRHSWGARAVPVCEELPACNHFTVMHDLADPQGRSHQLARKLLGLRWYSGLL
jgi:arylformamidase